MEPLQLNPNLLKKTIGYSPQSPSVYDKLTCRENLDLFASLFNISPEIKKININILLGLVNLKEFEDKRAEALSGGMRKRLDLACALVHDPKIVLLDEPTSDLDIMLRNQMWDLIKKINEKGTTIIMSSHFLDEIETLCDRIAIIHNNTLAFIGSPRDLRLQKNRGLTIKLETATRDYTAISEKIKTEYPNSEIHMSQIMEIDIKNVTVPQATVQKITQIILQNNQEIVDFSYSKEGLSEVFKEITGHKIKNPDRLIDEHHKLKEKLKEERHKLAKQNAKNHKWKI